jgi:putative hydrolase of the HAD superfamily
VKAVLFDLDGTLLDHDGAARAAVLELHAAYGSPRGGDAGAIEARWHEASERHYDRYLAKEISYRDQRRERVRDFFSEKLSDDEANARFARYFEVYERSWALFPDALPCLDSFAGFKLGVVSNGDGELQNAKVKRLGIADRFAAVVVSGEVGLRKPGPEIFALACARLGVEPAEASFAGDRLEDDAMGAHAAGLRAFWVDRQHTGRKVPAGVTVIGSLADLPGMLL